MFNKSYSLSLSLSNACALKDKAAPPTHQIELSLGRRFTLRITFVSKFFWDMVDISNWY